jgi:hypothetical protein
MKHPNLIFTTMLCGLLSVLLPSGPAWAQADPDEARMETIAKNIDKETSAKGQTTQLQVLAKEFQVSTSVIQELRANKQGWGEVTIELAMAQHLSQTDPKTYPTLASAVTKIESLRAEKMGWGKIAKDLGFKLGPVVSAAERTRGELLKELRTEKAQRSEKMERSERAQQPERPERPGR